MLDEKSREKMPRPLPIQGVRAPTEHRNPSEMPQNASVQRWLEQRKRERSSYRP